MEAVSDASAVASEESAPDVGDFVTAELEGGIEAEGLRPRRVVSPSEPVDLQDQIPERVLVAVVAALE